MLFWVIIIIIILKVWDSDQLMEVILAKSLVELWTICTHKKTPNDIKYNVISEDKEQY